MSIQEEMLKSKRAFILFVVIIEYMYLYRSDTRPVVDESWE
jgi:hypothetical protein